MSKKFLIVGIISILLIGLFSSCLKKDRTEPTVRLLGVNGKTLKYNPNIPTENPGKNGENDTVVMMHTKYIDPWVLVEDNKSDTIDMVITSDITQVFANYENNLKYVRRTGDYKINYDATDEELNTGSAIRYVRVANISEFFVGSYSVKSEVKQLGNVTNFNGSLSMDNSKGGAITFPKVYSHTESGTEYSYRITGYLFSDLSDFTKTKDPKDFIGYLGVQGEPSRAFYEASNGKQSLLYREVLDSVYAFTYLKIDTQELKENSPSGAERTITIKGVESGGIPESNIVYDRINRSVRSINLKFTVQSSDSSTLLTVEETYTPRYDATE